MYRPYELPADLANRMIEYSRSLDLVFTGWDLKVDFDGRHWCLEVNPMPGYHWYDRRLGGAITSTILQYFAESGAQA